ncbi:MAG: flavin prenyltransferase UbiX [Marinilabiliales bacterium]
MKIVVAISGASGAVYAKILLDKLLKLKNQYSEIALVISNNAKQIWESEISEPKLEDYPFKAYDNNDFNASFASGSTDFDKMIICPCSMGMIGRIAHGYSNDLISRAADVMLKERKTLILAFRESPLNIIHIKNLETITSAGGIIFPLSPSFYSKPGNIEELCSTVIDRILEHAGFNINTFRWGKH